MLQCDDGHWAGDYGGPLFLMPGMIIAFYVTGTPLEETRRAGMEAYLRNHQQVGGHLWWFTFGAFWKAAVFDQLEARVTVLLG